MTLRIKDCVCRWHRCTSSEGGASVVARGEAFLGERYFKDSDLATRVAEVAGKAPPDQRLEAIKELASTLDGFWALAVEWSDGETIAAVDRLRSIPLFYARTADGGVAIANNVVYLNDCVNACTLNDEAIIEFLLAAGYVIGPRTLLEGVSQMQAGEILHWKDNAIHTSRHFRFLRSGWSTAGQERLTDQLGEVMDHVFSRFVRQYADQRIYVSLSGGLDSRLVLAMLKRHGHKDLVALNYGQPEDRETKISKAVAEAIDVPWESACYNEGDWQPLMASQEMREFWRYAGQDASMPHIQDYLALHQLRQKHPRLEATFFSGMVGDMIAGAWVPDHFTDNEGPLDRDEVCRWMFFRKYGSWPARRREKNAVLRRMREFLDEAPLGPVHNSAAAFDLLEFESRQAKYIGNSVRSAEAHGFGWQLPLCTNELMDFYLSVPTELRELKRLYALWMRDRIFVGPMARLAEIPPSGDGRYVWHGVPRPVRRYGMGQRVRRLTWPLLRHTLLPHISHWRIVSGYMQRAFKPLRFFEWFVSSEAEAKTRTLGELLDEHGGIFDGLPPAAAAFASRFRHYPVCLVDSLGALALAYLADVRRTL
ncbi:MAG: asparagine synthase-related protein [Thermoguttaceae bacterium]